MMVLVHALKDSLSRTSAVALCLGALWPDIYPLDPEKRLLRRTHCRSESRSLPPSVHGHHSAALSVRFAGS